MDNFLEILNILEGLHSKHPNVNFASMLDACTANNEHFYNLDDSEILKRLNYIIEHLKEEKQ